MNPSDLRHITLLPDGLLERLEREADEQSSISPLLDLSADRAAPRLPAWRPRNIAGVLLGAALVGIALRRCWSRVSAKASRTAPAGLRPFIGLPVGFDTPTVAEAEAVTSRLGGGR